MMTIQEIERNLNYTVFSCKTTAGLNSLEEEQEFLTHFSPNCQLDCRLYRYNNVINVRVEKPIVKSTDYLSMLLLVVGIGLVVAGLV